MSAPELSKRERRLRAAVARAEARALELWPDEGSEGTRRRHMVKRMAFVQGAMFWRYADQVHAVEGADARRRQSEADKASSTVQEPTNG